MKVAVADLAGSEIAAFLDERIPELRSSTPLEGKYALGLKALREPEVTFWSITEEDMVVG